MEFLNAKWENIIMANYAVPKSVLKEFLPKGCELDLYKGSAYVSLVGFMFKSTKIFKVSMPLLGTFEEINLRFYVTRKEGDQIKRGVVFVNETIPYKLVAWMANKLYKEHYTTVPTKSFTSINTKTKDIKYQWKVNNTWNSIHVTSSCHKESMQAESFEEYIFEHYYGYTKINDSKTEEYNISHPRWKLNKIMAYNIKCDFSEMYGSKFEFLNEVKPNSIFLAEGSEVSVDFKRKKLSQI